MLISVVINTKNAAQTLARTLDSVSFADEVVVMDMHSSDQTVEIATKYGAKVFVAKDVGYVEPAREMAIAKAQGEWILVLDADEVVPLMLAEHLQALASGTAETGAGADCYYLARQNNIWGQWIEHTGWWPDYVLRFFKKGFVHWPPELHSVPVTKGKVVQLPAKKELALEHYNYDTVSAFIERLNRYTGIQADEKSSQRGSIKAHHLLRTFRQEFIRRMVAERGFLDKQAGVGLSLWQAISEVTVLLKIWQNQGSTAQRELDLEECQREIELLGEDFRYWVADYKIGKSSGLEKMYWRLRRKLKR